jgi:hypothetical protein
MMFEVHKQFFRFIKTSFLLKYIAPNLKKKKKKKIHFLAEKSGLGIKQRANNLAL